MLDLGRYLLGVAYLLAVIGSAWLGATAVRRRFVPVLNGPVAQLATAVLTSSALLWTAELLGTFGLFEAIPYLIAVIAIGVGTWTLLRRVASGGGVEDSPWTARRPPHPTTGPAGRGLSPATPIALAIAAIALVHFAAGAKLRLSTGMTGFDSTWYHAPFAAGFFQRGDTWSLHFIAPQFLAWFYPANSEVAHAVGMLAFGRDVLSPLLNLGWFVGCLVAAWCIGRPYRVAPWSLALAAAALSVPALHDQAGEARNDIVGVFFLLAALGPVVVVGLAAGLAAGTKLNFLLPAAVLVVGLVVIAPRGDRWRTLVMGGLSALAGGGYWYLRNLFHSGNPLPWVQHLGPIDLPAPDQALGGREAHSILGYLTDGSVWSDWFLPGLHHGLTILWPLLVVLSLAGLLLCLGRRSEPSLRAAALVGLAAALAWLVAPTSASGPEGMPRGFESGLRYLAPSLILGLTLLPTAPALRNRLPPPRLTSWLLVHTESQTRSQLVGWGVVGVAVVVVGLGYPAQRHYLAHRYRDPTFSTPGLNAAFKWAQGVHDARIATTSTRQYPLFGRDLSNEVDYIGEKRPHGGFTPPTTCQQWRRLLDEGDYDYVVTSRDRIEPGKPTYPPTARWTKAPGVRVVLLKPPTIVFKLGIPLDPSACRR
ncbi:MAG TPA: hypothetical protein VG898_06320 [Solirubrobacterales bacterium]|nr:hypothetical protein [Solirubrobacterales bacterium]